MKKYKKGLIIFSCFIVTIGFLSFTDDNFKISKGLDIYFDLFKELNFYYVDNVDPEKLVKSSIDGMLETLDPYTSYIPESEMNNFKFQTTGQYGGIGVIITKSSDYVVISELYENFPADKAGLKIGDIITEIEGKSIKNKNISDVSEMLKGTPETEVSISIKRPGLDKIIKKKVIREKITIPNVPYFGVVSDSIGYIRLTNFTLNAGKDVKEALVSLKRINIKSLILDLRSNPGGLIIEAINVSNIFIPKDQLVVSTKGRIKESNKEYYTYDNPVDTTIPLVVLVNRGTASASEIVSGTLQDLDRAVIIGQRTYGKGLVQQTVPLSYNTQLKVTTAKYYIPSGRCIQALDFSHRNADGSVGYIPDSLISEFKTKAGRKVYDGGGIQPDIKANIETQSNLAVNLYAKNFIFDFATNFVLSHKSIPNPKNFFIDDSIYNNFIKFLEGKDFDYKTKTEDALNKLISTAKSEKYYNLAENEISQLKVKLAHDKYKDLQMFRKDISSLLTDEIVNRYYYQKGSIEVGLINDPEVIESINLFKTSEKYYSILSGKEGNLVKNDSLLLDDENN